MKSNYYKRVLLVEDNKNDVDLILATLKENNVVNEIIVAIDGEEALDFLYSRGKFAMRNKGNPIAVLLDLKLPKISGMELLKEIKTVESLKQIPVVILTSSNEDISISDAYKLGANAYVVKPVDFNQFIDIVKNIGIFWAMINEPCLGSG